MGNWILYSDITREYPEIIMNVNSFAKTDKELNYVIWKAEYNDDDDDEEREIYLEKFYSRYNH
jgi:hypothetical protein